MLPWLLHGFLVFVFYVTIQGFSFSWVIFIITYVLSVEVFVVFVWDLDGVELNVSFRKDLSPGTQVA